MPAEDANPLAGIPEVGAVLAERYRIERVLGVGGMGVVVGATHLQLGEKVAIKFLKGEAVHDDDGIARFKREAWAAAKIKNEHVAKVTDIASLDDGRPYLVMEHLEGQDLGAVLDEGVLSITTAVDYLLQASEAIAEAHKLGIIHRDLKPENLFVTRRADGSPWVKVLDFGISKFTGGTITNTATLMGSPLYMAPEQLASAKHVDARVDVWALGVILFELLAGEAPFAGDTLPQICTSVMHGEPRRLQEAARHVPDALDAAVMRCLEKDPADRFPTIGGLADAIAPYGTEGAKRSAEYIQRVEASSAPSRASDDFRPSAPSDPALGATVRSEDSLDPSELASDQGSARQAGERKRRHLPGVVTAEPVSTVARQARHTTRNRWLVGSAAVTTLLGVGIVLFGVVPDDPEPRRNASHSAESGATPTSEATIAVSQGSVGVRALGAPSASVSSAPTASVEAPPVRTASPVPIAAPPSPPKPKPQPQTKPKDPWQGR